jgi:cytochrome c peroxidase
MLRLATLLTALLAALLALACNYPASDESGLRQMDLTPKEALGKLIFFDAGLSTPPGQSCASCHAPESGFGDPNPNLPVSRGAHLDRFGKRNDLTVAYAAFIPPRRFDEDEEIWVGGLFWDGRSSTLADQAKGPPLNPLEMANPDVGSIVEALRSAEYASLFQEVYGEEALDDPDVAYDHMADAIAAYEMTREVSPFSSKYDLYLAGELALTEQEQLGLALFVDETRGNCAACHPSEVGSDGSPPLFTDFTYDNLGTPKNPESPFYLLPPELNPDGADFVDLGLGAIVADPDQNGKFRVPTLRNVGLTPPYMHNGVFKTLHQVVMFYNTRDVTDWPPPEVAKNVNRDELGDLGLTVQEVEAIVAFMLTLSDGYEADRGP